MIEAAAPITEPLFYCPTLAGDSELIVTGDEAHHVSVHRLRPGDAIALFDGRGQVVRGTVMRIERKEVGVRPSGRYHVPPPAPALDLYSALPKGERLAVMLDMATQLGMSRFIPVRWERSVAAPGPRSAERWQRICLEACKQSRRLHLPALAPVLGAVEAVRQVKERGDYLILAQPGADIASPRAIDVAGRARVALFVGPEGGLTDAEIAALQTHGAQFVQLGAAILRIETAAVALLAAMTALTVDSGSRFF